MGGVTRHDSECETAVCIAQDHLLEALRVSDAAVPEILAKRDGVTVEIENKRSHHPARRSAETHAHREREPGDGMGCIHLAIQQFLPDGGPADLTTQFDAHSMFAKQV